MKIGRYLIAAILAEVIGFVALCAYNSHSTRERQIYDSTPHEHLVPLQHATTDQQFLEWLHKEIELTDEAHALAFQLDVMDAIPPFLIGFPAVAVLSLWIFDRRRKQKESVKA
jgi:hypothetical protein